MHLEQSQLILHDVVKIARRKCSMRIHLACQLKICDSQKLKTTVDVLCANIAIAKAVKIYRPKIIFSISLTIVGEFKKGTIFSIFINSIDRRENKLPVLYVLK